MSKYAEFLFKLGANHAEFLEKTCDLFEDMSQKLPLYQDHFQVISAVIRRRGGQVPVRLFTAMAFVYSDLLQFCFDICQIFSRRRSSQYQGRNRKHWT
jgi:hypothetical protein